MPFGCTAEPAPLGSLQIETSVVDVTDSQPPYTEQDTDGFTTMVGCGGSMGFGPLAAADTDNTDVLVCPFGKVAPYGPDAKPEETMTFVAPDAPNGLSDSYFRVVGLNSDGDPTGYCYWFKDFMPSSYLEQFEFGKGVKADANGTVLPVLLKNGARPAVVKAGATHPIRADPSDQASFRTELVRCTQYGTSVAPYQAYTPPCVPYPTTSCAMVTSSSGVMPRSGKSGSDQNIAAFIANMAGSDVVPTAAALESQFLEPRAARVQSQVDVANSTQSTSCMGKNDDFYCQHCNGTATSSACFHMFGSLNADVREVSAQTAHEVTNIYPPSGWRDWSGAGAVAPTTPPVVVSPAAPYNLVIDASAPNTISAFTVRDRFDALVDGVELPHGPKPAYVPCALPPRRENDPNLTLRTLFLTLAVPQGVYTALVYVLVRATDTLTVLRLPGPTDHMDITSAVGQVGATTDNVLVCVLLGGKSDVDPADASKFAPYLPKGKGQILPTFQFAMATLDAGVLVSSDGDMGEGTASTPNGFGAKVTQTFSSSPYDLLTVSSTK